MRKLILGFIFSFIIFFIFYCSKEKELLTVIEKFENGIKITENVHPSKIKEELITLKENLRIKSGQIKSDSAILFNDFDKDSNGDIFLLDRHNIKVYKFNNEGKKILSFLRKGNGPGEFSEYPKIQISGNYVWIIGWNKIGKFSADGDFIDEFKLKNFYDSIIIPGDKTFFGTKDLFIRYKNNLKDEIKILGHFDLRSEKLIFKYIETKNLGCFYIKIGNGRIRVNPDTGIIPDITFTFDDRKNILYCSEGSEYEILKIDKQNKLELKFSLLSDGNKLSYNDKNDIIESFGNISDPAKKKILEKLPEKFASIKKIIVLPHDHILIEKFLTLKETAYDLFDENGKFKVRIKFDFNYIPLELKFFRDSIGTLEEKDEEYFYHEYGTDSILSKFIIGEK